MEYYNSVLNLISSYLAKPIADTLSLDKEAETYITYAFLAFSVLFILMQLLSLISSLT